MHKFILYTDGKEKWEIKLGRDEVNTNEWNRQYLYPQFNMHTNKEKKYFVHISSINNSKL